MSRRKRRSAEAVAPDAGIAGVPPDPTADVPLDEALPTSPADRRLAIASVVIRNAIGVVGVLFLGWPAQALIVLYFLDTLGALLSIFSALLATYFSKPGASIGDRLYALASALALGAFLAAFFAIPLGAPIAILMMATSWNLKEAFTQPGFLAGVVGILGMAVAGAVTWWMRVDTEGQRGERALKREFTLVFGRWILVIFVIYTPLVIFVAAAPAILVVVYAAVTAYTELFPERFERFFNRGGKK